MLTLNICLRETCRITKDFIHLFQAQTLGFRDLEIMIRDPIVFLFSSNTHKKYDKETTQKGEHLLWAVSPDAEIKDVNYTYAEDDERSEPEMLHHTGHNLTNWWRDRGFWLFIEGDESPNTYWWNYSSTSQIEMLISARSLAQNKVTDPGGGGRNWEAFSTYTQGPNLSQTSETMQKCLCLVHIPQKWQPKSMGPNYTQSQWQTPKWEYTQPNQQL